MNKITKNTIIISKFKNQEINFHYTVAYCTSQRINQVFEILELYSFAFTASAIDKTFTHATFYRVSMYFPGNL